MFAHAPTMDRRYPIFLCAHVCMCNVPQAFYCVCGKMCVCSDLVLLEIHVCFSVCVGAYIICVSVRAVCKYAEDTSPLGHRVSH